MEKNEKPTVSLCMIARDEERFLEEALLSVAALVDEIILVDTGSVDRTKEIAQKFDAAIYDFEWCDDFSLPRNLSIQKASSDWILVLDADERIDESDHEKFRSLLKDTSKAYLMTQRHYSNDHRLSNYMPCQGEFPHWEKGHMGFFESSLCRLFPRRPDIEYRGRIHELTEHSINECRDVSLIHSGIRLHHFGHIDSVKKKKKKSQLYTKLGEQKSEEQPTTWKGFHELGVEHNCNGRLEESAAAFKRAVELNDTYLDTWVNYGYVLMELKRYEEAFSSLSKALEIDQKSAEAHCNMGVLYMRRESYIMAISHFKRAITLKPDYLNAYSNLGQCLMKTGDVPSATRVFQQAYELSPQNIQLLTRFGFSLVECGIIEEAIIVLNEAIKINEQDERVWYCLSEAYTRAQMNEEAVLARKKFEALAQQHK